MIRTNSFCLRNRPRSDKDPATELGSWCGAACTAGLESQDKNKTAVCCESFEQAVVIEHNARRETIRSQLKGFGKQGDDGAREKESVRQRPYSLCTHDQVEVPQLFCAKASLKKLTINPLCWEPLCDGFEGWDCYTCEGMLCEF